MKTLRRLTLSFSLAFSASLLSFQSVNAADEAIVCTGKNLLPQIAKEAPEIAASLKAEAEAIPYGQGLTWRIEKDGVPPSYLFGTMHLSDPRMLELKPGTKAAFDGSTALALEITEIIDPKAMASKAFSILQYTMYSGAENLDTKLKSDDVAAVKKLVQTKLGLPWNVASKMKPWALMGSLALPACELARKRAQKPFLDMKLGLDANASGKTLVGLETLESQMQAMASLPEEFALNGLLQSVRLGNRMDDLFETMIQLYLKEDMATVWALMRRIGENGFVKAQDNTDYAEFQQVIVDARNFSMVDAAIPLLEKGNAFIAVGALHLPGEKGIANILVQKGYKVTRVTP